MSKKHVLAVWFRVVVLGLLFLVLSLYILLASGFLGDVPGNIIGSIVSDDSFTLTFKGLHTDIFWNTSADSVIVTDSEGLVVAVTGIQIDGSLLDYLLSGHVDRILVDRLHIHLATDPVVPYDQPDSLISILNNIDTGIAASTDRLYLRYGIITEFTGTIIDSMYIDASIERISGVALNVDSSGIYLPGFGSICGCGLLRMNDGNVTTDGFTGTAAPGSLLISGILSGSEGTLDVELSGSVGTSSYDIPVDLSVFLEGSLKGKLSDLRAELALSRGSAVMFGNEASFEVDTLSADLQDITVGNLYLVTDDAELNFDGEFDIESCEWSAVLHLNMTNTDISEYLTQFSTTNVIGSIFAECRGTGYSGLNGAVTVDLAESFTEIVDVSTLHIDAVLSNNSLIFILAKLFHRRMLM